MKRKNLFYVAILAFALAQQTFARPCPVPPPPPEPYWPIPFVQMIVDAVNILF